MRAIPRVSVLILVSACASIDGMRGGGDIDAAATGAGSSGAESPAAGGTGGAATAGSGGGAPDGGAGHHNDGALDGGAGQDGSGASDGGAGQGGDGGPDGGGGLISGDEVPAADGAGNAGGASTDAPDCSGVTAAVAGEELDPAQVYLAGTLSEGTCGRDALAHWSSPGFAVVGFDCHVDERSAWIRPSDGRLLYSNVFEDVLREFRCDACPLREDVYPAEPLDNDAVVLTPPCHPERDPLAGFLVSPTGTVLYRCRSDGARWYDESGRVAYANPGDPLLHLGHGGLALAARSVVHLETSTSLPISGLPGERLIHTVRARAPDRFLLVLEAAEPAADGGSQELWEVNGAGHAERIGVFPPLPAEATQVSAFTSKLDGCGALLQFGGGIDVFEDVIVRRETSGASEVVYTEAADPLVKIHVSSLFTGP